MGESFNAEARRRGERNDMGEQPSCYTHAQPRAKKEHKCCECHGMIPPGETYHRISGVWDGTAETFKRCSVCHEIAEEIDKRIEREYGRSALIEDGVSLGNLVDFVTAKETDLELLRRYVNNAFSRGAVPRGWVIEKAKLETANNLLTDGQSG